MGNAAAIFTEKLGIENIRRDHSEYSKWAAGAQTQTAPWSLSVPRPMIIILIIITTPMFTVLSS